MGTKNHALARIENAQNSVSYSRAFYVRFRCEDVDCHCDVEIRVRGCVTQDGGRLYEYATSKCPRCGHQLFRAHQLLGEVDRVKEHR